LIWDESGRSFLLRERAEARMAQGDVRASVADARLALANASTSPGKALCRFLLGLGLERSGDLPGALGEMRLARLLAPAAGEQELLDMPGVFVLRPLDADYAAGLAARAVAEAELVTEPKQALAHYEQAIARFASYVKASPRDDRWLVAARSELAACERAHEDLSQKLGASAAEEPEPEAP
jgi:tetratricopeptide (TPR) repeat protein